MGAKAMLITRTPLRVSFAGGGSDFPDFYKKFGGKVVSCAIDKYLFVIIKARWDDKIYVNYSKKEIVDEIDDLEHDLVREAMRLTGMKGGIEVTTLADIPSSGSGLGSSSALTVGLLNAFHNFRGRQVPNEQLAEQACRIELDILGRPMGVQDAWPCAMGGLRAYEFGPGLDPVKNVEIHLNPGDFAELQRSMTLFYTGITRRSETILTEQKSAIAERTNELQALTLLAEQLHNELEDVGVGMLGAVLEAGWKEKRKLASGVSNPELDQIVTRCMDAGAEGVKICGAGGGGFVLVIAQEKNMKNIRSNMGDSWELPVKICPSGSEVIFRV
jgi:D-glycero-alpha-D-manno-heptose-7-phosphate kinase